MDTDQLEDFLNRVKYHPKETQVYVLGALKEILKILKEREKHDHQ